MMNLIDISFLCGGCVYIIGCVIASIVYHYTRNNSTEPCQLFDGDDGITDRMALYVFWPVIAMIWLTVLIVKFIDNIGKYIARKF